MTQQEFYGRPLVRRLIEIFRQPGPPAVVTERQFDDDQDGLERLARKQWHQVIPDDYWCYLMDMAYVSLQPQLFEHIFPAFLIAWWEGQLSRLDGPEAETDFYYALDRGQVLETMLHESRREAVLDWMAEAYLDGVNAWTGPLVLEQTGDPVPPLNSFHALGMAVPVSARILLGLVRGSGRGIAKWWVVLGAGIAWYTAEGDFVLLESSASIYDHGYRAENRAAIAGVLTVKLLLERLAAAREYLTPAEQTMLAETVEMLQADPTGTEARLRAFLARLAEPQLGGWRPELTPP